MRKKTKSLRKLKHTTSQLQHIFNYKDVHNLLYSMIKAFTKAIDERTPYNASHTMHVAKLVKQFALYLNQQNKINGYGPFFTYKEIENIVMAAHLHDVGKLVIPLEIMNKSNRLGVGGLEKVHGRFALIKANKKIDLLEKRVTQSEYREYLDELQELEGEIRTYNSIVDLPKDRAEYFRRMGERIYVCENGTQIPWLTEKERENLQIIKGTLNSDEREEMKYHVVATEKILSKVAFGSLYEQVPELAQKHHEFLDGSGYPQGLTEKEIPLLVRLLTICDIYDSLVATDRPYKKPMPQDKAMETLREMANEGKLDKELVTYFGKYLEDEHGMA